MIDEINEIINNDEKAFEERADNIDDSDLSIWNIDNGHFLTIQKKLIGTGAKLIVGPRGIGKTHQMRIVYNVCIKEYKTNNKPIIVK